MGLKWWPDWRGQTAVIIGGGPSAAEHDFEIVRGRARVLAINNAVRLCPWADVLYACDGDWWRLNNGVTDFAGLKVSQDKGACETYRDVHKVKVIPLCADVLIKKRGTIAAGAKPGGGHSGFQAINLAVQFGAKRLVLVGFDMRVDLGLHWHGPHPKGMNNPELYTIEHWRAVLDEAAPQFEDLGVEVLNASQVSALTAYRKVLLTDIFPPETALGQGAGQRRDDVGTPLDGALGHEHR